MSDAAERELRNEHAKAAAELYIKREEFFSAVRDAYQDPAKVMENLAIALRDWGVARTLKVMEETPGRFGAPRGAWWTLDRYAQGGNSRAEAAAATLSRLPDIARAFGAADDRERNAREAYERYCRDHGLESQIARDPPQVRIPERQNYLDWLEMSPASPSDGPERERDR